MFQLNNFSPKYFHRLEKKPFGAKTIFLQLKQFFSKHFSPERQKPCDLKGFYTFFQKIVLRVPPKQFFCKTILRESNPSRCGSAKIVWRIVSSKTIIRNHFDLLWKKNSFESKTIFCHEQFSQSSTSGPFEKRIVIVFPNTL